MDKNDIDNIFKVIFESAEEKPNVADFFKRHFKDDDQININDIIEAIITEIDDENFKYVIYMCNKYNYDFFPSDSLLEKYLNSLNDEELKDFFSRFMYEMREKFNLIQDTNLMIRCLEKGVKSQYSGAYLVNISDEDLKLKLLPYIDEESMIYIVQTFKKEENIINAIKYLNNNKSSLLMIMKKLSDDAIIKSLKYLDLENQIMFIRNMKSDDHKISFMKGITDEELKTDIIITLQSDDMKIKLLSSINEQICKAIIINSINDIKIVLQEYSKLNDEAAKSRIIMGIRDKNIKEKLISELKNERIKAKCIQNIHDEKIVLELISQFKNEINIAVAVKGLSAEEKIKIAKTLKNREAKEMIMTNINFNSKEEQKKILCSGILSSELCTILRKKEQFEYDVLLELIDTVEKIENDSNKIVRKDIIRKFLKIDSYILNTVNFNFMNDDFVNIFTEQQLYRIAKSPEFQSKLIIVSEDNKKFELLKTVINKCNEKKLDYFTWINTLEEIVDSIVTADFDEVIQQVDLNQDLQIDKLIHILSSENYFNISTINEMFGYSRIKNRVCDSIISGDSEEVAKYSKINNLERIDQLRFAVLEKLYGQDIKKSKHFINLFGYDIEKIEPASQEDENLIIFINSIKRILLCTDEELLKRMYEIPICVEEDNIKPWVIEKELKRIFCREYNKGLYNPKDKQADLIEDDIPIYEAGTDFKMIITSIGAFVGNTGNRVNYCDDWNRTQNVTMCFSASYIRNDMVGTAPIIDLCYGFCNMEEESLVESSPFDLGSKSNAHKSTTERRLYFPYSR